jgi:putative ABC transport system permease protein
MSWFNRLSNLVGRRDLNAEIDEELQFHVETRIRDNIAAGMTPPDARREALRRFGAPAAYRDATRDTDIVVSLEALVQDVTFALRCLARRPAVTGLALLTLALGIGVNTSMFTIVQSVLLRPLPFAEPERLHVISHARQGVRFWLYPGMVDAHFAAFRDQDRSFEAIATFGREPLTLTGGGDAARVVSTTVTPDFLRVLRVSPAAGRSFGPQDVQDGSERVVLVSDALWRGRFGAHPALVNRRITLDGEPHTVIGIMPAGFSYPGTTEIWTPLAIRLNGNLSFSRPVIGRLKPGVSREQAQAAFEAFIHAQAQDSAEAGWAARVIPLRDAVVGDVGTSLLIFSGAVAFVLLIACANVANLLLMRAIARRQETATRLALGASRARVIRLLMTEGTLVALGGGLLGVALAVLAQPALLSLIPPGKLPRRAEVHLDVWVLMFTLALSAVTAIVVGIVPALQARREDLSAVTRETSSSSTPRVHRIRHALVVAEVALALVLLVGAGLLAKSFLQVSSIDPGFDPRQVTTMTLDLPLTKETTADTLHDFHGRLLAALSALPKVHSAAAINWLPLGDMVLRGDVVLDGGRSAPGDYIVTKAAASPRYFSTMGIPLRGRDFSDDDRAASLGVAIVSEAAARQLWPNEDPIGKRLSLESKPKPEDWLTVVGVAGDIRQGGVMQPVVPAVYQPYAQVGRPGRLSRMAFVVRNADDGADTAAIVQMIRGALRTVDPNQAPQSMSSMEAALANAIAEPQFQTRLVGIFSSLALVLAAIGIYGVLAASVMERQREIGIRMALGADRGTVVAMVIRRTLALTASGVALGMVGASAVTRVLTALLHDVAPTDVTAFAVAAVVLAGVGLLAGLLPARRASAVDPVTALRTL